MTSPSPSEKCELLMDHCVMWDGAGYSCTKCGIEFALKVSTHQPPEQGKSADHSHSPDCRGVHQGAYCVPEGVCEKNCPDYHGMEILHREQCGCSCHKKPKETTGLSIPPKDTAGWEKKIWEMIGDEYPNDARIICELISSLLLAEREKGRNEVIEEIFKIEKEKWHDAIHCTCLGYALVEVSGGEESTKGKEMQERLLALPRKDSTS